MVFTSGVRLRIRTEASRIALPGRSVYPTAQRMRWAVGYTLRPGKPILEAAVRILNRTPEVNTMLCFANLAVHANENYQVIFPPSTQFGVHHAKREFTDWPISHSTYGGADFSK